MEFGNTWVGYGTKFGGIVGLLGLETMSGEIANMMTPSHSHELSVTSIRAGVGLGGGAGIVAILLFNCSSPYSLNGTRTTPDWSANLALGANWSDHVEALKNYKLFQALAQVSGKIRHASPENLTSIRNGMSYIYSAVGLTSMSGPTLVTLDIPGMGVGVELSVCYLDGEIEVGDLVKENWATSWW
jgi:hypothetical protein